MKTTIGGDRLGSGNKQNVSLKNYSRSTHDLSYTWRSTMAPGTLVPFMNLPILPGDSLDINLDANVLTLPTLGPLFGSFKVQLDVFTIPVRIWNAALHMNKLGIGMDMSQVVLPRVELRMGDKDRLPEGADQTDDNVWVNPSSLTKYLGISGHGWTAEAGIKNRAYNAIPLLSYWSIYKQYYANKQEERGFYIHVSDAGITDVQTVSVGRMYRNGYYVGDPNSEVVTMTAGPGSMRLEIGFPYGASEVNPSDVKVLIDGVAGSLLDWFTEFRWQDVDATLACEGVITAGTIQLDPYNQVINPIIDVKNYRPQIQEFDLNNIDKMREQVLQAPTDVPFYVNDQGLGNRDTYTPYVSVREIIKLVPDGDATDPILPATSFTMEGLGLKTYQSDLFNNWISTEWIDGDNGINAITAVDTSSGEFTIDSLNLANKVYNMLNRIAISGGSYDDWLDAVYTHERSRSVENPVYQGSLIKELAFQEVVSNADTNVPVDGQANTQPLGTLAGKGRLTSKNKGGRIKIKASEISYVMAIASITPLIDYSQGNEWHVNLDTMNDFHKPALDAIGYQSLITEQMAWQSTQITGTGDSLVKTMRSAGKQPAWINYMTAVNKTYGNFAIENNQMFMTLNRRYEIDKTNGAIKDLTTYIDPGKYNFIFAQSSLDSQNFWVQIRSNITARRKMSAKVIPNL